VPPAAERRRMMSGSWAPDRNITGTSSSPDYSRI
jgi:hypothetical protein